MPKIFICFTTVSSLKDTYRTSCL